jgi:deoxyribonuclease V
MWPADEAELERAQDALAAAAPAPWRPDGEPLIGACFVCFGRGLGGRGTRGEPGWAAAALDGPGGAVAAVRGVAGAPYVAGRLALREGPLLAAAVRALPRRPDVLLADATGRDHPRRAGLALHLGAVLDLPTVGVTHRPLTATGSRPASQRGAFAPLALDDEPVGAWVCTRTGARPVVAHAAWRTTVEVAVDTVLLASNEAARTPIPLKAARHVARTARAADPT